MKTMQTFKAMWKFFIGRNINYAQFSLDTSNFVEPYLGPYQTDIVEIFWQK